MKKNQIIITVLIIIAVGVGAFFAGMKYQQMQRGSMMNGQFTTGRMQGQAGMGQGRIMQRNGQAPIIGEIVKKDDTSITIKMQDGSSKIVILSATTAINKEATGNNADLKTGENVMVVGATNADGSVTAQNIQLNPAMRMRGATPSGKVQ